MSDNGNKILIKITIPFLVVIFTVFALVFSLSIVSRADSYASEFHRRLDNETFATSFAATVSNLSASDKELFLSRYWQFENVEYCCGKILSGVSLDSSEVNQLADFLFFCKELATRNEKLNAVIFQKIGYALSDFSVWINQLGGRGDYLVNLALEYLRGNFETGTYSAGTVLDVSDVLVDTVKLISDLQIENDNDNGFVAPDGITYKYYYESMLISVPGWGLKAWSDRPFCILDNATNGGCYTLNNDGTDWVTVSTRNGNRYPMGSFCYVAFYKADGTISEGNTSFWNYGERNDLDTNVHKITTNKADVMEWLGAHSSPWDGGAPVKAITSSTYNNYDSSEDHSFTVSGDYVNDASVSNDYEYIVSAVTDSNDFTDNSVTTIINNYYNGLTIPSGGSGSGDDGNGGSGGLGIFDLLGGIANFLDSLLSVFGRILSIVGNLLDGLMGILTSFSGFADDFGAFLASSMTFLPEDAVSVIVAGISAVCVISIFKLIRG